MRPIQRFAAAALAAFSLQAEAFVEHYEGTLGLRDDVAVLDLNLSDDVARLYLWTDSFAGGARFDPMVGLWRVEGNDARLVAFNDDGSITTGQTWYDSGQIVEGVAAGAYRLSVTVFPNDPIGSLLSQGFAGGSPESMLPEFGHYSLYVTDVSPPPPQPVPEPATWALMIAGLGLVARVARRGPPGR